MKIDSVNIISFGGLKDFRLDFEDGMNIIYGDNEAGKSTIMAFIEMMFYGKTAQEKSTDISKSLRKRYTPWDGSAMCGELEFTYDNRRYRIHKVFKKTIKTDEVKLYDADTGNEIPLGRDEEIGQRFFGIDVASFEKSVYISGFGGFAGGGQTNEDIAVKLSNLVTTMDEEVSQSVVLGRLSKAKELLRSKSGSKGILPELEGEVYKLNEELVYTKELMGRQSEYTARRNSLNAMLEEKVSRREIYKKLILKKQLEEKKGRLEENQRKLTQQKEQLMTLLDEGEGLKKQEETFKGKNYSYDTVADYVSTADELRRAVSAKQGTVDELTAKAKTESVIVDKADTDRARLLENKKDRLIILNERISTAYKPALSECEAARTAETEGQRIVESLKELPKVKMYIGAALLLLALICAGAAFATSLILLAGTVLLGAAGAFITATYIKQKSEHERAMANCRDNAARLTKERLVKENRLMMEKERLFERGAGLYPDMDCDYEKLTNNSFMECCSELSGIYDRYGVENLEELEQLSASNEETRINHRMYEEALSELEKLRQQYEEYTRDADPEQVREDYNRLKEKRAAYNGKLQLKGIDLDNPEKAIKTITDKLQSDEEEERHQLEELEGRINELGDYILEEDGNESLSDDIESASQENERSIEDIREQLTELASLIKTPKHEPLELKKNISELKEVLDEKKELYEALSLAEKNMQEAVDDISRSFGPVLNERTAAIFSQLTGGKYEKVMVDKEYSIQVKKSTGSYHDWRFLSNGTTDQAYLALRLAMTELITDGGERLPVMLDDVLLQYDEQRAGYAMEYLEKYAKDGQLIYFTCHPVAGRDFIKI